MRANLETQMIEIGGENVKNGELYSTSIPRYADK